MARVEDTIHYVGHVVGPFFARGTRRQVSSLDSKVPKQLYWLRVPSDRQEEAVSYLMVPQIEFLWSWRPVCLIPIVNESWKTERTIFHCFLPGEVTVVVFGWWYISFFKY